MPDGSPWRGLFLAGARLLVVLATAALVAVRLAGAFLAGRARWLSTMAHSSSLRELGLLPCSSASLAAFSMSAIRFFQEVAKRLSLCDLAALSTRVSTTPAGTTFLRRRLKISFCS